MGDCSDPERTGVEERFFADDETFARLCELEEELAARYARGELRADERSQFERAYSAPPRRDRLILNLALGRLVSSTSSGAPATPSIRTASWRRWLTLEPAAARWALAAASVVLLIGGLVQFREADRLRRSLEQSRQEAAGLRAQLDEAGRRAADSERQTERASASANGNASPPPVIATFVLTPGLTRNARGPTRVDLPPQATAIRFQLNLDFDGGYSSLNADLRTSAGASVWTERGLSSEKTADGSLVIVTIPATSLANGEYELLLQGVRTGNSLEDAASYHFTIVR
jgi:hypothetical protein